MPEREDQDQSPRGEPKDETLPLIVNAEELFRGCREIWIEHGGDRYRLRITRRNKLILQK